MKAFEAPAMRVIIAHPGLQYAHHLASAVHESANLLKFWSGVPLRYQGDPSAALRWPRSRLAETTVPASLRSHAVAFPIMRRITTRVLSRSSAVAAHHRLDHLFDRWIAPKVAALRPDLVVCYENSALRTFEAAKRVGAVCVLDAASIHYMARADALGADADSSPEMSGSPWINRQKEQEIQLADAILTCSPFAAATYTANDIGSASVHACPLGSELAQAPTRLRAGTGPVRFIFIGSLIRRKGVDLLLDAVDILRRDSRSFELTLLGGPVDRDLVERAQASPHVTLHPFVGRRDLFRIASEHDCLVLPSQFDSFGMVVPEAMSVGLPAILSEFVGARMIIDRHPRSGWIVPLDAGAIAARMASLIDDPRQLGVASSAAVVAAQEYSWPAYRQRVSRLLTEIYAAARP